MTVYAACARHRCASICRVLVRSGVRLVFRTLGRRRGRKDRVEGHGRAPVAADTILSVRSVNGRACVSAVRGVPEAVPLLRVASRTVTCVSFASASLSRPVCHLLVVAFFGAPRVNGVVSPSVKGGACDCSLSGVLAL